MEKFYRIFTESLKIEMECNIIMPYYVAEI